MSSYRDMEDEIDQLTKDKRELITESIALNKELNDSTRRATESKVWLRCYTSLLTYTEQADITAIHADNALEEYKKRFVHE